jgi:hypothetical protein
VIGRLAPAYVKLVKDGIRTPLANGPLYRESESKMDELGLDAAEIAKWFAKIPDSSFAVFSVESKYSTKWAQQLSAAVRRCYISDEDAQAASMKHGISSASVIASKIPDPGSVMSGDFGEILALIYRASEFPQKLLSPKKWRLKQDRLKPAPHSDVVHLYLPHWPKPSNEDQILCSEVKTKSTKGAFDPIAAAVEGREKDRTSRLANTLVWLRERAITGTLGNTTISHLERFIHSTRYPESGRRFYAVAVVCSGLAAVELEKARITTPPDASVVVIVVPNLKNVYMDVFNAVRESAV